ncbi:serine hydrolase [Lewinella sp. W8]|uniref:serine hydrolase n=1 Tax=Lewinella sp. W8 TaxID=2528208 RepID=UPI00106734B1|nr:serine hydrolase [Lewinella sp. W8]MTB51087.1 serine hydrolase [Lewinella sp. W8]
MRTLQYLFLLLISCSLPAQAPYEVFRFDHDGETLTMLELMEESNTPGVSIALDYGAGDTAFVAQLREMGIGPDTQFPAGAASCAPVAIGIMQLVDRGVLDLDAPVNQYLKRAQLPLNRGREISLRDVLLLRAKLSSGYKPNGYPKGAEMPDLPTMVGKLSPSGWRKADDDSEYGGWLVLQMVLEDHYGEPLAAIMDQEVFAPLGLNNSFYATELSDLQLRGVASGHRDNGAAWPDGYRRYPEQGFTGLWTTPTDYVRLVRAVLDAANGASGGILSPATARRAMERGHGFRSLIFHLNDEGLPYWGGNAKGFYFQMQAHPAEDWICVAAVNRNLNWRLGGPVVWQGGLLAKQWRSNDRLGIVLQEADLTDPTVAKIEHFAFTRGIRTERIMATTGLPEGITATPAYLLQNDRGRAIYSGSHNAVEGIIQFIQSSRVSPKKSVGDTRTGWLMRRGRQKLSIPLKVTVPTGNGAPDQLPEAMLAAISESMLEGDDWASGTVELGPLDRRLYLDLHSYRREEGDYQITFALFSQFNCHTPVSTNFGSPLTMRPDGTGASELAGSIKSEIAQLLAVDRGLVGRPLPLSTPVISWGELGWELSKAVIAAQGTTTYHPAMTLAERYEVNLVPGDQPGLFFGFPAPLDRYSGSVNELRGAFLLGDGGRSIAGNFALPVSEIKTGNEALDYYVLDDLLKQKKHPTAALTFAPVPVPEAWRVGERQTFQIPAVLSLRGKRHDVLLDASFILNDRGELLTTADFYVDFRKIFKHDGPDGPDDIRRRLEFSAAFTATR